MSSRPPSKTIMSTRDIEAGEIHATLPEFGQPEFDELEIVPADRMATKAAEEAFMNEKIQIVLEESDKENAACFESAGHNGITQYFRRGEVQEVKRKFVYALLQAKAGLISVSFGKHQNGNEFNSMTVRKKRTHGITLVKDSNPKGREWFAKVSAAI